MNKEFITSVLDGIDENYIAEALCPDENRMAGLRYRDNTEFKGVIDDPISDYINNRTVGLLLRAEAGALLFCCLLVHKAFLPCASLSLAVSALLFAIGGLLSGGANAALNLSDHDEEALYLAKKRRKLFLTLRVLAVIGIVLSTLLMIVGK